MEKTTEEKKAAEVKEAADKAVDACEGTADKAVDAVKEAADKAAKESRRGQGSREAR
jgi:hypothetical protein